MHLRQISKILLFIILLNCQTMKNTPIIIYEIPKCDVSDDMSIEQYIQNTTEWGVKIKSWINELINQIKNKVNYIDLRKKEK